jgi:O-antigen/teichoic acid export membrane protein
MSGFLFDKLLLSYLTDLRTMAYYSVAAMIGTQIHNVLVSLGIIIFPKVSARQEQKQDLMPIYRISRFALAAVGWAAVLFLFLSSDWLINWWLGAETYENAKPFILLYLAYEAVLIITIVPYQMINGSEAVRYNSWYEILHRSMQILFILILGKMMGSQGIIWGLIVGTSIALPYQYFVLYKKVLKSGLIEWPPLFIAAGSMVLFILSHELMFRLVGITAFFLSFFLFYGIPAAKTLNARFQDHE